MSKKTTSIQRNSDKRRKTIGFLTNQLPDRYQSKIWPGILDCANERDYNLITFAGKNPKAPYLDEAQETILYKLVSQENVDGLIILTGAIGNYMSKEEIQEFCDQYKPLPMVSIPLPIEGVPSIQVDNKTGMREIVSHFVKDHHYKRVAFIRGPVSNDEAEVRYQAYREVLAENQIEFDPELVYEGKFVMFSGSEAVIDFLDKRKVKFDAIIAANDDMILGVYQELTRRGIKIPEEVAIGGFDDIDEARYITPSITTVSQPLYEQARKATETLIDMMEGKPIPEESKLSAYIVIRQSCGCRSQITFDDANMPGDAGQEEAHYQIDQDLVLEQLSEDMERLTNNSKEIKNIIRLLLEAFLNDLKSEKKEDRLIREISYLTATIKERKLRMETLQIIITRLYEFLVPYLKNTRQIFVKAQNIYNNALVLLLEIIGRYNGNELIRARDYNWAMRYVLKTLSSSFDLNKLRDEIMNMLPRLGISYCFIGLYEGRNQKLEVPSPKSEVYLAYQTKGKEHDYDNKIMFDSVQLIPEPFLDKTKRYSFVVYALASQNEHFGYIIFDFDPNREPLIYETIQGHVSNSLRDSLLLETVWQQSVNLIAQKEDLSKNLDKLRRIMGEFITSISLLVETRDPYTAGHQNRVADLAGAIAAEMGFSPDKVEGIIISGVLHDLGKIYVPTQILNKPGKLIDVELNLIKIHPQIGYNIIKEVEFTWPVADIIVQHHERYDGSGYPAGLKGDQILIEARILCVADVVEAMASHRPYRPALGLEKALEEITINRGKYYDPDVVDSCVRLFQEKRFEFKDTTTTNFQFLLPK